MVGSLNTRAAALYQTTFAPTGRTRDVCTHRGHWLGWRVGWPTHTADKRVQRDIALMLLVLAACCWIARSGYSIFPPAEKKCETNNKAEKKEKQSRWAGCLPLAVAKKYLIRSWRKKLFAVLQFNPTTRGLMCSSMIGGHARTRTRTVDETSGLMRFRSSVCPSHAVHTYKYRPTWGAVLVRCAPSRRNTPT